MNMKAHKRLMMALDDLAHPGIWVDGWRWHLKTHTGRAIKRHSINRKPPNRAQVRKLRFSH